MINVEPPKKSAPRWGNIIGIVLCVLLLPIVVINITLAIKSYIHPEKVATFLGVGPLIVETGSMEPTFAENDVLLIQKIDASKLEIDNIIAFYDANGIVVSHRIISSDTDETGATQYYTKGDSNNVSDRDPVPAVRVAGLVIRILPGGGKYLRMFGQPLVAALILAIPMVLGFGISKLLQIRSRRKQDKEVVSTFDEL
jgi:signal peptidase